MHYPSRFVQAQHHYGDGLVQAFIKKQPAYFALSAPAAEDRGEESPALEVVEVPAPTYLTGVGIHQTQEQLVGNSIIKREFMNLQRRGVLIQEAADNEESQSYAIELAQDLASADGRMARGSAYNRNDCVDFIKLAINWPLSVPYLEVLNFFDSYEKTGAPTLDFPSFVIQSVLELSHLGQYGPGVHSRFLTFAARTPEYSWLHKHRAILGNTTFDAVYRLLMIKPLAVRAPKTLQPKDRLRLWKKFKKQVSLALQVDQQKWRKVDPHAWRQLGLPKNWMNPTLANTLDVLRHADHAWDMVFKNEELGVSRYIPERVRTININPNYLFTRRSKKHANETLPEHLSHCTNEAPGVHIPPGP
ncbi:hypothetical protein JCM10207_005207 [Rhodosporidiobolus poonsookiae]